jgi:hypothetical protein
MNRNGDETRLADALVVAVATARRFERRRRRAAQALLAGSLLLAAVLALRPARPPDVYVIRGDSTGVVLTGPGVARRAETMPVAHPNRKGDRT